MAKGRESLHRGGKLDLKTISLQRGGNMRGKNLKKSFLQGGKERVRRGNKRVA